MRINSSRNTMDMEARDINYFFGAYMLQYLYGNKNVDPKEIIVPMFPAVPHPRVKGAVIPIKYVAVDDPIATEIIKDGSHIPETPIEEMPKEPEAAPEPQHEGGEVEVVGDTTTSEAAEPTEQKEESKEAEAEVSPAKAALLKAQKERVPKQPPGGDIGSGHADNIGSRDAGFDKHIINATKHDRPVDESKEQPTDIKKEQ